MNRLALALVAVAAATAGHAMEKPYVGVDYQLGTYEPSGNISTEPSSVRLRAGTELNPYLAVEAQLGVGAGSDTLNRSGVQFEVEMNSFYGLFLRPQVSLGSFASVYALAGAAYVDMTATSNNPAIPSDDGFRHSGAYGAGLDFQVMKNVRLNVDYIQYLEEYSAISAGIRINLQ